MSQKSSNSHTCEMCNYSTHKMTDFIKHINTQKHSNNSIGLNQLEADLLPKYKCNECAKVYLSKSGLWNHKKKCSTNESPVPDGDVIMELLKQNQEFKNIIVSQQTTLIELANKMSSIVPGNNNTNNNHFNLQFFLNDTCKDAITASEFVNELQISFADLEYIGTNGYVEGIFNVISNKLKSMEFNRRPFHCTDLKRETVYIKENNCWIKETDDKLNLKSAIKLIAFKNIKQIKNRLSIC